MGLAALAVYDYVQKAPQVYTRHQPSCVRVTPAHPPPYPRGSRLRDPSRALPKPLRPLRDARTPEVVVQVEKDFQRISAAEVWERSLGLSKTNP